MLHIFYSNKIEVLYENLKRHLFQNSSPFEKRVIIVPTPALKSWLTINLAQDKELEIATGFEILFLEETLKKLILKDKHHKKHYPSLIELSFCIESFIRNTLKNWVSLDDFHQKIWLELFNYLNVDLISLKFSKKSENRLIHLSHKLAKYFADYSQFGQKMLESWNEPTHFQHLIWKHLFYENDFTLASLEYNHLSKEFLENLKNYQIHLFANSFISEKDHLFLETLSQYIPVNYYIQSHCYQYYADVLTDRESQSLYKFWEHKNVSKDELFQLETYLNNKNPLLANLGKLNRKMQEMLEKKDYFTEDLYIIPEFLKNVPEYAEILIDEYLIDPNEKNLNLLNALQSDIFLLRNPNNQKSIFIDNTKNVAIHACPTKRREVQILYHNLLRIIKNSESEILASDIIVLAPDIAEYTPYIKHYFGNNTLLDFQILDEKDSLKNTILSQVNHFLGLPFSKWNLKDFFKLFNFDGFKLVNEFSDEDIQTVKSWFEKSNILWGQTPDHRNELLKSRYQQVMLDTSNLGTFEEGFSILISKLILKDNDDLLTVDSSQSILLGKCILLMRKLKKDFSTFTDGTLNTYGDWVLLMKNLIQKYLFESSYELDTIFNEMIISSKWVNEKVSFNSFKNNFDIISKKQTSIYKEKNLNAVSFYSIAAGRSLPAKIICLLGMEEGTFPRVEKQTSFNLMQKNHLCDYKPSSIDFDRYLFLETISSAKQYLILSYTKYAKDGKEQSPSLLISELLNYLNVSFKCQNSTISEKITFHHPYDAFDKMYFSQKEGFNNLLKEDYLLAVSFYNQKKQDPHHFISHYKNEYKKDLQSNSTIDIQHLKNVITNPIKAYFNHKLNMWISEEKDTQVEENFDLGALDLYKVRELFLKNDLNEILTKKKQILPLGALKKVAINKIIQNYTEYQNTLSTLGINKSEIFDITLDDQCKEPHLKENVLTLPAFELNIKDACIKIIGKISNICPLGLIRYIDKKTNPIKVYVEFLIVQCLIDKYQLGIKKQVLGTKQAFFKSFVIENPFDDIKKIICYYFSCQNELSPLNADWLEELIEKDSISFSKFLEDKLKNTYSKSYNHYLNWTSRSTSLDAISLSENGKEMAKELFENFFALWNKK